MTCLQITLLKTGQGVIRIQKSELLGEAIKASFIQPPEISSLLEVPYPLSMKHSAGSMAGLAGVGELQTHLHILQRGHRSTACRQSSDEVRHK